MQHRTALRGIRARTPGILRTGVFLANALFGTSKVLMEWQSRASERAHLRDLEARFLNDVGMTSGDRDREVRKPFWQR